MTTSGSADTPFFLRPSEEGARLALKSLLVQGGPQVEIASHCAVAIDVYDVEGTLVQRALAHADAPSPVRDAFRELVDRAVSRFAESQRLDAMELARRGAADPYRGGFAAAASNEFAGFDCGHALATANTRLAKLRASLRDAASMDIRLYAVPFLHARIVRDDRFEQAVILRKEDGEYAYELFQ
ncbi:MAG: hypothetical protein JST00_17955 [Deltaproteobacteria bacterium]|nr:hypothetical protein [Deltaproteobacteria bacterium]